MFKIKNEKITRWKLELACFRYDIAYRSGKQNAAADALSRIYSSTTTEDKLHGLHEDLCHPGVTRMIHFVRSIIQYAVLRRKCQSSSLGVPDLF